MPVAAVRGWWGGPQKLFTVLKLKCWGGEGMPVACSGAGWLLRRPKPGNPPCVPTQTCSQGPMLCICQMHCNHRWSQPSNSRAVSDTWAWQMLLWCCCEVAWALLCQRHYCARCRCITAMAPMVVMAEIGAEMSNRFGVSRKPLCRPKVSGKPKTVDWFCRFWVSQKPWYKVLGDPKP